METTPQYPVPVFPLPDLVLFPHTLAPLHVFELRYRAMVRDALQGERLIAMALLKPGWEQDYHGSPEYFPLGCLARLETVEWRPDDCYDLTVSGLTRVRIAPASHEYPYRAAKVRVLPQEPLPESDPLVDLERQVLKETCAQVDLDLGSEAVAQEELPLEAVVNRLCLSLPLEPIDKLRLLEIDSLLERSRLVREIAARAKPPGAAGPGGEARN